MSNPHIPLEMIPQLMREVYGQQTKTQNPLSLTLPKPYADWQKMLMTSKLKLMVFPIGTKCGKALNIDTDIPTPDGWKKMGSIFPGDFVFNEQGEPIEVEAVSEVMHNRKCYEVIFSDDSTVIADAEHLWATSTIKSRRDFARNRHVKLNEVRTTEDILNTLKGAVGGKSRFNHSIHSITSPVQFKKKELPIDPYLLGVWLGDGWTKSGALCINENDLDIIDRVRKTGREVHKIKSDKLTWRVTDLTRDLIKHNLYGNKHIPEEYLVSSFEDRLALLQGLMDTDGTIYKRKNLIRLEFDNTIKQVVEGVRIILASFGIKSKILSRIGKINGVEHKRCYRLGFFTSLPVFSSKRKLDKIGRDSASKSKHRTIIEVKEVPSVPVKCIKVASDTRLFLCTKSFIPTHNTLSGSCRIAKMSFAQPPEQDALFRIIAPTYQLSGITFRYLQRLLPPKLPQQPNFTTHQQQIAARIWEQFTPSRSDSKKSMVWKHNGARIACVHGQDPEVTIEGERVHGNIFDEASKMKQQVYSSALSTTSQTGGWNVLFSTPRGKNWFFQLYMECNEHMRWALKNDKPLEMFAATARTIDSPYVDQKVIAQAKRTLPDRIFRQLYLAEFVDDGSVFTGFRECLFGPNIDTTDGNSGWQHDNAPQMQVVIGADWAKRDDYTVFVAIEVGPQRPRIVGFRRLHGLPYIQSVKELARFCKQFDEVLLVRHDRTGVGDVIDEILQNIDAPIDPVVFTNQSKSHMVDQFSVALSTQGIQLPQWDALLHELDVFDVRTNQLGKPIYSAIPGQHDDIVTACYLAWSALLETQGSNMDVTDTDTLLDEGSPKNRDTIESWYASLIEEDEDF